MPREAVHPCRRLQCCMQARPFSGTMGMPNQSHLFSSKQTNDHVGRRANKSNSPTQTDVSCHITCRICKRHSPVVREGLHNNTKHLKQKMIEKINVAKREGDHKKAERLQHSLKIHEGSSSKPVVRALLLCAKGALLTTTDLLFSSAVWLIL